jgi:hypothetical protein
MADSDHCGQRFFQAVRQRHRRHCRATDNVALFAAKNDAFVGIMPAECAMQGHGEQEFRQQLISQFQKYEVLDRMIDAIKAVASETGKASQ